MTENITSEQPNAANHARACSDILKALHELLFRPVPPNPKDAASRATGIKTEMHNLETRGITDGIIRYGLVDVLALQVLAPVLSAQGNQLMAEDKLAQWRECLQLGELTPETNVHQFASRLRENLQTFKIWASTTNFQDLINLNPPDITTWKSLSLQMPEDDSVVASYVWLCDRYLSPDLTTWTTQSLHKEYRYIHSGDTDSFSENALEPITIDNNELNSEIAKRAVFQQKTRTLNIQYGKLIDAAEQNLRKQDYRGAAALFKFYLSERPESTDALNSQGFCLIPDSPEAAAEIIQKARVRGFHTPCLSVYNLCCCHYLLQDFESALRIADQYRLHMYGTRADCVPTQPALIWQIDGQQCELQETHDIGAELAAFCIKICEQVGDTNRLREWTAFQEKLKQSESHE